MRPMNMFLFKDPDMEPESFGGHNPYGSENGTRFLPKVLRHFVGLSKKPNIVTTIDGPEGEVLAEDFVIEQSTNCFNCYVLPLFA